MIITHLLGEQFRKYKRLSLEDLPESGVIFLVGLNESGKSAIGEAIAFALCGRTDHLSGTALNKLVRWGAVSARVKLSFKQRNHSYQLIREVDTAGVQTASLKLLDQNIVLADDVETVSQSLKKILGYGEVVLCRTFFYSQALKHANSTDKDDLQAMVGIKAYVQLMEQLEQECVDDNLMLQSLEKELYWVRSAKKSAVSNTAPLEYTQVLRDNLGHWHEGHKQLIKNIPFHTKQYLKNYRAFRRIHYFLRCGRYFSIGVFLTLLISVLLFLGVDDSSVVKSFLQDQLFTSMTVTEWEPYLLRVILSSLGLLGIWGVISVYYKRYSLKKYQEKAKQLAEYIQKACKQLRESIREFMQLDADKRLSDRLFLGHVANKDTVYQTIYENVEELEGLPQQIQHYQLRPEEMSKSSAQLLYDLRLNQQLLEAYVIALDSHLMDEGKRLRQFASLDKAALDQEKRFIQGQHHLKVQRKALQLLQAASTYSVERFKQAVLYRCGELVAEFTMGRYHSLDMNTDLVFRVLAQDKGDYLEVDELSSGVQQQIALAIRLTLAQVLAESTDASQQFIFLDEPFTFFDEERRQAAQQGLQRIVDADYLQQIFLVSQVDQKNYLAEQAFIVECQQS